jgi:hypothetical protein
MQKSLMAIAKRQRRGGVAVFVLGKSSWNGNQIPTTKLFEELGHDKYRAVETLWYPLKNRYMSYARHNNASIDREYVLVFQRT